MITGRSVLSDSLSFRHDECMPDWERLGDHVVARRVKLGYGHRAQFAAAAQMQVRVLSDIENGRRGNYDKVTIARLEGALGWETGSAMRVANGGEPILLDTASSAGTGGVLDELLLDYQPSRDEALMKVMRSNLPDSKKRQIIRMLIAEREAGERRRAEHAEELIQFAAEEEP